MSGYEPDEKPPGALTVGLALQYAMIAVPSIVDELCDALDCAPCRAKRTERRADRRDRDVLARLPASRSGVQRSGSTLSPTIMIGIAGGGDAYLFMGSLRRASHQRDHDRDPGRPRSRARRRRLRDADGAAAAHSSPSACRPRRAIPGLLATLIIV